MLAALVTIIGTHARNDALDFLSSLPASRIVIVNGRRIETPDPILDALKTMRLVQAHHSHPAHTIDVEIVAGARILRLRLGRDSQDPNEYWVYDPKYRVTNSNEIGHVFTDTLARY